jgi:2,4-dienoyl-CoA reductase-like NADH-dependent reductase (Old Yellow Enzyme family)
MIKLGVRDSVADGNGLTIEEGAKVARTLEQEGLCLVEISHGISTERRLILGITKPEQEACFRDDARVVRAATEGPICLVAGFRSLPVIEETLASGVTDMIGISRPLIREPDLIKRWKNGNTAKAKCISCGGCFGKQERGHHRIGCRQDEVEAEEGSEALVSN